MYAEFLDKRFQMYENYRIRMIILPSLVIMPTKRQAWCMIFWHLRRLISFNFLSWSGNKKRMLRLTWPLSSQSCSLNVYVGNLIFRIIWLTQPFYLRGISDGLHRYAFYVEDGSSWLGWFSDIFLFEILTEII